MTGTVASQAIMLAALPILTRIYAPDDFGLFGVFSAILSVFGVAACLRYDLAVPLPKRPEHAASVFFAALATLLCTSAFVVLLVAFFRESAAIWLGTPGLASLLWLLPASVFAYGVFDLLNYWSTRNNQFGRLAKVSVLRSVIVVATQLTATLKFSSAGGLVLGQLAGQLASSLVHVGDIARRDLRSLSTGLSWGRIRVALRRYQAFPRHGAPQAMLNAASQSIPVVLLGLYFDPTVVGFYVIAHRVVSAPLNVVSQSIRQALLPEFARRVSQGRALTPALKKYTLGLTLLAAPVAVGTFLFGGELFGLVLGQQWTRAGEYAVWVVLWLSTSMVNPVAVVTLTVLEKQSVQLLYEVGLLAARILTLSVGGWVGAPELAIGMFSVAGALFNGGLVLLATIHARTYEESVSA